MCFDSFFCVLMLVYLCLDKLICGLDSFICVSDSFICVPDSFTRPGSINVHLGRLIS